MTNTNNIEQDVILDNKEIYMKLSESLASARSEIIVAVSWFTDPELLKILLDKASEGIKIDLIISDNGDNEKLDFSELINRGAEVIKIKSVGYGIMHHKFCVIDNRIALHGSYNWSKNARNNNQESIIVTDHQGTVEKLVTEFKEIKQRAKAILSGMKPNDFTPIIEEKEAIANTAPSSYASILDSMIAAEVSSFDREGLRTQGYDRAQLNNGDHQILPKALDTLYNGFVNDIDVVEDKKRRLLSKIDEQKIKMDAELSAESAIRIDSIIQESQIREDNLNSSLIILKSEIKLNESAISDTKDTKIPEVRRNIQRINQEIDNSNVEFVKPKANRPFNILVGLMFIGLCSYAFLFYSSAAYIMVYGLEDAKIAQNKGGEISPGIFEPKAFSKAMEHGTGALVFICLFIFLPIGLALIPRIIGTHQSVSVDSEQTKWKRVKSYIQKNLVFVGILLIDGFIAYKVAKTVNAVENLSSVQVKEWSFSDIFIDVNFYLVMVLGALGLVLIKYLFGKIIDMNEAGRPDIASQRNEQANRQRRAKILELEKEQAELLSECQLYTAQNISKEAEIKKQELELSNLPLAKNAKLETKKLEFRTKIQEISNTTDIYKSHVENDNVPVSVDALKDRINVFLEGWNDYLHKEYSIQKAVEKSAMARTASNEWQEEKSFNSIINSRLKK